MDLTQNKTKKERFYSFVFGRWGGIFLVILAGLLFLFSSFGLMNNQKIREFIAHSYLEAFIILQKPVVLFNQTWEKIGEYYDLSEMNRKLIEENKKLLEWREIAFQLRHENNDLKRLLDFIPTGDYFKMSGRVLTDYQQRFSKLFYIVTDSNLPVWENAVVTDYFGVVGRIITVNNNVGQILTLSDIRSHVPVKLQRTGVRGILSGKNTKYPELNFTSSPKKVRIGDRVVTTNDGLFAVPDLFVGYVVEISDDFSIKVQLAADFDNLDYVKILQRKFLHPVSQKNVEHKSSNDGTENQRN